MRNIWVISDTHFGHENIIGYSGRPFKDHIEMDEAMVARWQALVQPDDTVYHLGDVYFTGGFSEGEAGSDRLLSRLPGRKFLVLGNHDKAGSPVLRKHFKSIRAWVQMKDFGLVFTHMPLHETCLGIGRGNINIHGHIHERLIDSPFYMNLSVEHTDYSPVNLEEIIAMKAVANAKRT